MIRAWKSVDDVELATLGWVTWFNTVKLHGTLNDIPPAEYEAAYAHPTETNQPVGIQRTEPPPNPAWVTDPP